MAAGVTYIFEKYAGFKDINKAKKRYWLYRVYEQASKKPSIKNLKFILKNFQFNFTWFKHVIKFIAVLFLFKKPNN
jgi:hypothetical protein